VTIHGHDYTIACGVGEEDKQAELVSYVNKKINEISLTGPNATENRLLMLTCLLLADELVETKKAAERIRQEDEELMVAAVDHLRERIASIAEAVG
jgi:cell division protein ZapA